MPNYTKKIVYLSESQYQELITNHTITVNGVTIDYDENTIYMTPQNTPLYATDLADWAKAANKPTYTAQEVGALPANTVIPTVPVQDVQVNGVSVLNGGVANVPKASQNSELGVIAAVASNGIAVNANGQLYISAANADQLKAGSNVYKSIVPSVQHASAFYGLAKAAGDTTQSASSNAVGTYTDTAKSAIRTMLGAASSNVIAVQDTQPTDADTKIWLPETAETPVQVPTVTEMNAALAGKVGDVQINGTSMVANGIANLPMITSTTPGIAKVDQYSTYGINVRTDGTLQVVTASDAQIKSGSAGSDRRPITPSNQHASTFYGLAKAAGDSTQSASSNAVGTYTDDAKSAIRTMLGAVGDVQVDGTSIVTNGIANVPIATTSTFGAVKCGTGLSMMTGDNAGKINTKPASTSACKNGVEYYAPITPNHQHEATFYGLAKASGDTTQSASSNAVGTYTDNAKASIKSMLGIVDGSTGTVEVSGAAPTITAVENTRYVCGEVTSLTLTPPASGICIVRFTSGSSQTLLTLPSTVKFPEWFDPTTLETNTIYEICITDGIYGAVMSWAQ